MSEILKLRIDFIFKDIILQIQCSKSKKKYIDSLYYKGIT